MAERMTQTHPVALLIPLAVGAIAVLCTLLIHALAVEGTVNFIRYEKRLGREGIAFGTDLVIVILTLLFAFVAHLIENRLVGGAVRNLRRISRIRNCLLPLSG